MTPGVFVVGLPLSQKPSTGSSQGSMSFLLLLYLTTQSVLRITVVQVAVFSSRPRRLYFSQFNLRKTSSDIQISLVQLYRFSQPLKHVSVNIGLQAKANISGPLLVTSDLDFLVRSMLFEYELYICVYTGGVLFLHAT